MILVRKMSSADKWDPLAPSKWLSYGQDTTFSSLLHTLAGVHDSPQNLDTSARQETNKVRECGQSECSRWSVCGPGRSVIRSSLYPPSLLIFAAFNTPIKVFLLAAVPAHADKDCVCCSTEDTGRGRPAKTLPAASAFKKEAAFAV